MEWFDVSFNGATGKDNGVILKDYPTFSGAGQNYTTYAVYGGLGELVGEDEYQSNLEISCVFSILSRNFMPDVRRIRRWLSGSGRLVLSDSRDVFYKVMKINYGDISRELRNYGTFSSTFVCSPYEYHISGQKTITVTANNIIQNRYSKSRPIYTLSGSGQCTLTVNGKEMQVTVGSAGVIIDTEKMLAYNSAEMLNTAISGDYEDLYLLPGDNSIAVSSGFSAEVTPNWGYRL